MLYLLFKPVFLFDFSLLSTFNFFFLFPVHRFSLFLSRSFSFTLSSPICLSSFIYNFSLPSNRWWWYNRDKCLWPWGPGSSSRGSPRPPGGAGSAGERALCLHPLPAGQAQRLPAAASSRLPRQLSVVHTAEPGALPGGQVGTAVAAHGDQGPRHAHRPQGEAHT